MTTRPPHSAREIVAALTRDGWSFTGRTHGGHLIFEHPTGGRTITSGTPSARGAHHKALAQARRQLREGTHRHV